MTEQERSELMQIIRELSYEQREVTLASGRKSDFYFDGKQTTLHPRGAELVGKAFFAAIAEFGDDVAGVGGLTMGADPIATATAVISAQAGKPIPAFIIRKEPKGHGTGQWLEGRKNFAPGARVVIVEDVVTTGGSSMKAIERARSEGLEVLGVVTLVDREEGGREFFAQQNVPFRAIFTKSQIVS